jgi:6-phosphogluconolactonase
LTYSIGSNGILTPSGTSLPIGGNPSAITVGASGKYVYIIDRSHQKVLMYSVASNGALTLFASTSAQATGNNPMAILATPDDRYVYVANRDDNTISRFLNVSSNQMLTPWGTWKTGKRPEALAITPDAEYMYSLNTGDNTIGTYVRIGNSQPVGATSSGAVPVAIAVH